MNIKGISTLLAIIFLLLGCQSTKPIHTVSHVDLERFMGDWYVVASIPTFIEKDAYNAVESYQLNADGTIATTFTFNKGGFDGKVKNLPPQRIRGREHRKRRVGDAVCLAVQSRIPGCLPHQ